MSILRNLYLCAFTALFLLAFASYCMAQDTGPDEAVSLEVGKRIIALTVPIKDKAGQLVRIVHGSGYMLDEHSAITAAHVVRELRHGDLIVVQVGALRLGTNYMTTAKLVRLDPQRDLAIIAVDTGAMDQRTRLDTSVAKICDQPPLAGSKYLVGGMSSSSTGDIGIERHWNPNVFEPILSPTSAPETLESDSLGYWHKNDRVILTGQNANAGDSGAAVLGLDGCFMGVVSKNAFVKVPVDGRYSGPMFIVPVQRNDSILKGEKELRSN